MEKKSKLPLSCPSCTAKLKVQNLHCTTCGTNVTGNFTLPLLASLSEDEQNFIINFVKYSGSIKDMSKHLNLSYPSVRNILDDIIIRIKTFEENGNE